MKFSWVLDHALINGVHLKWLLDCWEMWHIQMKKEQGLAE